MPRPTTRKQREALWRLFLRSYDPSYESRRVVLRRYRSFRRRARWCGFGSDRYLGLQLWGMFIGIELNGYTHS